MDCHVGVLVDLEAVLNAPGHVLDIRSDIDRSTVVKIVVDEDPVADPVETEGISVSTWSCLYERQAGLATARVLDAVCIDQDNVADRRIDVAMNARDIARYVMVQDD
ncbi:hypothetical protein FQZ97_994450 [compost metagenome]